MKNKKLFSIILSVFLMTGQGLNSALVVKAMAVEVPPPPEEANFYMDTFIITAYYSPLPGQSHYVTGSYDGDIYLNGNGTNGADGTPVYPGMVAAPKSYTFGTKLYIPGVGLTAVHDRGGAIKVAGERGDAYDRLDIWMGAGDDGLGRALGWGKRTVEVMVYGVNPSVEEEVYFDQYLSVENFLTSTVFSPLEFSKDIYYGSEGEEVKKMQEYLVSWGYLDETSGFYGSDTAQAIFEFQLDFQLVSGPDELGAGHFGPGTRRQFDSLIKNDSSPKELTRLEKGRRLLQENPDLFEEEHLFASALELGDSGETVRKLQRELQKLGYLRIEPTGYFGETTQHALFKFQQAQGLISSLDDSGAGYLGPNTRSALNRLMSGRLEMKSLMAFQRDELKSGRLALMLPDQTLAAMREDEQTLFQ